MENTQAPLIVWISGDGGWGEMEREVTTRLSARGAPILGVDSLHYFIGPHSPARAAADIARRIAAADSQWGRRPIVVAGFSFGADIGPFVVARLPQDVRARVVLAAFLSPSKRLSTQVSPVSWLGFGFGPEVWPQMAALAPTPVLCVGGVGVFNDICPNGESPPGMRSVRLVGGHELHSQYDKIADLILDEARAPHAQ